MGNAQQAILTGRPAAPDEQSSSRTRPATIHHAVPIPPRSQAYTLNHAIPPLFHDAGNSDLLKHIRKRKVAHLSQSRNHKDGTAPALRKAPKPSQATKLVSAQGPDAARQRSYKAGSRGREKRGRGVPPRRTPGRNASSHFISAHCSKSPESAGSLRLWLRAGEGVGGGRPDSSGTFPAHSFTHSLASQREPGSSARPASVTACRPNCQEGMPAHRSSASPRGLTRRAMSETRGPCFFFSSFSPARPVT